MSPVKRESSVTRKRGFAFFLLAILVEKKRTETHKKAQKRAKMHTKRTDACSTPVYYTPR